MRKIIVSIVLIVLFILVFGPLAAGFGFQASYRNLLAFYNSQKNIQVTIVNYQRGWMSSDITLSVEVDNNQLQNLLEMFNITLNNPNKHYQFLVHQHVQHGPIIYFPLENASGIFGLAAIQSKLIMQPDTTSIFLLLGMSHATVKSAEDFVTFAGSFFNHLEISGLKLVDPVSHIQFQLNNVVSNVWIHPKQKSVNGDVKFSQFSIHDSDDVLEIDKINVQFNQYLNQYGLWLGTHTILMPEILFQEMSSESLLIKNFNLSGQSAEKTGNVSGDRQLDIAEISYDNQTIGPIHLILSAYKLNAKAIQNLLNAYQEVMQNGEEYQGQLRKKITMFLPDIIIPGTGFKLDQFNLTAPKGQLKINADVTWPEKNFSAPDNLREIVMTADAKARLHISKELMNQVIEILSGMPTSLRQASEPDRAMLLAVRDQMMVAAKQNKQLIKMLVKNNAMTEKLGDAFLAMQKDLVSVDEYEQTIKELFLTRKISLQVSYLLNWQYSQMRNPYQFLLRKADEYQKSANEQLQNQFKELLNQGYITEEKSGYVVLIKWSDGKLTVNGQSVGLGGS